MLAHNLLIQLVLLHIACTSYPLTLQPIESETTFLRKIIANVHEERPIETFLIMKRSQNQQCLLQIDLPTLRFDETVKIRMKNVYNSEALILVCMSEVADIMLLHSLAENTNRMRGARIIIWMYSEASIFEDLMSLIVEQAKQHNFLNLLVLHQASNNEQGPITPYRLQPFPMPTLQLITDINRRPIYPRVYSNFHGKAAVILPGLFRPISFRARNPRTGKDEFYGSSDILIAEFAKKHNIKIELHPSTKKDQNAIEVYNRTLNGELDLPISYLASKLISKQSNIEYLSNAEIGSVFVVTPCGREMRIGDIYKGLKNYSGIVLGAYFIFAVIETFSVSVCNRFLWGRYGFSYSHLFINLRVFCGVLGLPIRFNRHRSSFSLQQIVLLLSFLGIILTCFFNANLSTLLTKQPQQKQIRNFQELHASRIPLAGNKVITHFMDSDMDREFIDLMAPNMKFVSYKKANDLLLTLNISFAHIVYTKTWQFLNQYQQKKRINALCESPGLTIFKNMYLMGVLKNNSIFKDAMDEFLLRSKSFGFTKHWRKCASQKSLESVRTLHGKSISLGHQAFTPLHIKDFKWLGKLMAFFYGVSIIIFIGEILYARWPKNSIKNVINVVV